MVDAGRYGFTRYISQDAERHTKILNPDYNLSMPKYLAEKQLRPFVAR